MNTKKRYAIGYYNKENRIEDPEWMKSHCNRLVAFIYDNQDMFNFRYITSDKDNIRTWILLDVVELLKAKECFMHEETNDIVEFIDKCQDYHLWKTSCYYCDTITLNSMPYTYRDFGGSVDRSYECLMCSGLDNEHVFKVGNEYQENGLESAIDFLINL